MMAAPPDGARFDVDRSIPSFEYANRSGSHTTAGRRNVTCRRSPGRRCPRALARVSGAALAPGPARERHNAADSAGLRCARCGVVGSHDAVSISAADSVQPALVQDRARTPDALSTPHPRFLRQPVRLSCLLSNCLRNSSCIAVLSTVVSTMTSREPCAPSRDALGHGAGRKNRRVTRLTFGVCRSGRSTGGSPR